MAERMNEQQWVEEFVGWFAYMRDRSENARLQHFEVAKGYSYAKAMAVDVRRAWAEIDSLKVRLRAAIGDEKEEEDEQAKDAP